MKYIVYLTINIKNNKIYVGVHKTDNPDVFDGYIGNGVIVTSPSSYKYSKTPFQHAVNKYGVDSFKRATIKCFDDEESAYKLEYSLVTEEFIRRKDVYNSTIGGGIPPRQDRVIYQYSLKGEFIQEWKSIITASEAFVCSDTAIGNAARFKGSSCGFFWSFDKVSTLDVNNFTNNSNKQIVYQYSKSGILTNTYESIIDAANNNSENSSTIGRAIKGEYLTKNHYYSLSFFDKFIPQETLKIRGKNIHLYEIDGTYFKSFNTPLEAAKFFNLKSSSEISKALRLGRLFKNYQVSLDKVDSMKKLENLNNKPKRIEVYNTNGELIEILNSVSEARNKYGTSIARVLKGQQKQCNGFIFKYA